MPLRGSAGVSALCVLPVDSGAPGAEGDVVQAATTSAPMEPSKEATREGVIGTSSLRVRQQAHLPSPARYPRGGVVVNPRPPCP